jgi:archaetidylinositol phosphate synthase
VVTAEVGPPTFSAHAEPTPAHLRPAQRPDSLVDAASYAAADSFVDLSQRQAYNHVSLYIILAEKLAVLDRLRGRLEEYLGLVGELFSRVEASPTAWTIVGLAFSALSGAAYSCLGYNGQLVGGVLILAAGWFDIVDGAVARVTGRVSKQGAFLDSTLDRVAEVAIFLGILAGGLAPPLLVLTALSLSLLVSYARAKGDALGIRLSGIGIGERGERLLILAMASIAGYVGWGVILVAVVAGYTFLARTFKAVRTLRQV